MNQLTDQQLEFLEILAKNMGVVSNALLKMNLSRDNFDIWMKNNFFKQQVQVINEQAIDYVENQLMKKINDGDLTAIQFYLKTKGKKRGY